MDADTTGPASPHREQYWCQNNLKVVKSILQKFYCIGLLSAHYMQYRQRSKKRRRPGLKRGHRGHRGHVRPKSMSAF